MSDLPQSWAIAKMEWLAGKGQYGWTTKAANQGSIKFLRTTDITRGAIDWGTVPFCYEAPLDDTKYRMQSGDIVISRAGSVGFSVLLESVPVPTVFASYLIRYVPDISVVSPRYLANFLRSPNYWSQIADASAGVAVSNVNASKLAELDVPLAPFNEQKRIADKLDAVLARVDTCRERLDRVPAILKRFRQSVLAAATSGKLTEEWRIDKRVDEEWQSLSVGDICESSYYGPRFGKNEYTDDPTGIPTIRTTDMTIDGKIEVTSDTPRVAVPASKLDGFKVRQGDLLVTRTGSIGVMAIFLGDYPAIPSAYLIRFRFKDRILPRYAYFCLAAPNGQEQMGLSTTAITQPNINAESIKKIALRLPSIDEQREIIRRVDQLFGRVDQIQSRYTTARAQVERLTPSLLAKAFRGELVPQDPGDESAEKLLARIKAERDTPGVDSTRAKLPRARVKPEAAENFQSDTDQQSGSAIVIKRSEVSATYLSELLKRLGKQTPEALWKESQLEVDEFFELLRDEEAAGRLREIRPKNIDGTILLEKV